MGAEELVWYAGYGSNLSAERFHRYLTGGTVTATPNAHAEQGARHKGLPLDEWAGSVAGRLYFAGTSSKWAGGGVAFYDPTETTASTYIRGYLITRSQLEDVLAQENRADEPIEIDIAAAAAMGGIDAHPGSAYSRLHHLRLHDDGRSMFTITAAERRLPATVPDASYLSVIATGLSEAHGLSDDEIEAYLRAAQRP